MPSSALDRVAVALDTSDRETFDRWCRLFGPRVGVLKVGLECFVRLGPEAVAKARRHARGLFLDLKLHDIPNTVAGAVSAARALGADMLTVHAAGGRSMLEAAVESSREIDILAVTVLTHLDEHELGTLGLLEGRGSVHPVERWARLANSAGCAGVVSSPRELRMLRKVLPPPFLLVTPGIRSDDVDRNDQRRTTSPRQALEDGSDLLVIGRPLTRADDPLEALERLERELSAADG